MNFKRDNMKKIAYIVLGFLALTAFNACQKEDYKKEYNWAYPLSGDWTVNVAVGEDVLGTITMKTYNSSFGKDSIWVDDNGNFWPFKAKAKVDMTGLTFSTTNFISKPGLPTEDTLTITNGKVINKDSIYFQIEFHTDPGTVYTLSGHRKLSYEEYMGL